MKKYVIYIGSLFIAASLFIGCAENKYQIKSTSANTEVVTAEGTAPIINGDITGAKKDSLHEALKNALGLVIGVYVSQESLVSKSMLIEDNITSKTEGYVEKYTITKEKKDGDFYKVTIKALVRKEDLAAKLKTLDLEPKKLGNPVVKFNITETIDGKSSDTQYAANELKQSFVDKNFTVSDSDNCDILVTGNADTNFNTDQGLGGLISYRSTISLKVLKFNSQDIITTTENTLGGIDVTKAAAAKTSILKNVQTIATRLPDTVLKYLKDHSIIQLDISGIDNINVLNNVITSIRSLPEVRDSKVRNFSDNKAVIEINVKTGTTANIAKRLEQLIEVKIKVNKVSVYGIEAERIK